MDSDLVLIDREALRSELQRAFDAQTSEVLLRVLDKVAAQVQAAGVTREDFRGLKQIVADLAEAQRQKEIRLHRLEESLATLIEQVRALTGVQQRMVDTVGDLKGRMLEAGYRDKAVAYFGRWLRRPQVVSLNSLWEMLEAHLSAEALDDVLLLDLVVQGRPRQQTELGEVWLAVEVAAVVNEDDVTRARRRAALLQQAGYRAIPVVAGEEATIGAEAEARRYQVAVLQDGRSLLWDEALAAWAKAEG